MLEKVRGRLVLYGKLTDDPIVRGGSDVWDGDIYRAKEDVEVRC